MKCYGFSVYECYETLLKMLKVSITLSEVS